MDDRKARGFARQVHFQIQQLWQLSHKTETSRNTQEEKNKNLET